MNPQQFEKSRRDKYDGELVNERIRFNEVLLIGPDGEKLGVMSSQKALYEARDRDLDLICVSPNAKPPVCKIVNYGKYRFQKQKKAKEAKKNQKIIETKCTNNFADTSTIEKQIDEFVYQVYELSKDDIKIIEQSI